MPRSIEDSKNVKVIFRKIHEIFETKAYKTNEQCGNLLAGLKHYQSYLHKITKNQTLFFDKPGHENLGTIKEASQVIVQLKEILSSLKLKFDHLNQIFLKHPLYQKACTEFSERGSAWEVTDNDLIKYIGFLSTWLSAVERADLNQDFSKLQAQFAKGSAYLDKLKPLLVGDTLALKDLMSELDKIKSGTTPVSFIDNILGNSPRFISGMALCLKDCETQRKSLSKDKGFEKILETLRQLQEKVDDLARKNNGSSSGDCQEGKKQHKTVKMKVADLDALGICTSIPAPVKAKYEESSSSIMSAAKFLDKLKLKDDKYADTEKLTDAIKAMSMPAEKILLENIEKQLNGGKFKYLRQCGVLGFLTTHQLREDKNIPTSGSWASIQNAIQEKRNECESMMRIGENFGSAQIFINSLKLTKDKYADAKVIKEAIKVVQTTLLDAIHILLKNKKYNYLRVCGYLGFFTTYHLHDDKNVKTSASWAAIEAEIISRKPALEPSRLARPLTSVKS